MRESRLWPAGGCVDTSYRIDLHQLVVPANAGTHNHRCRSWSRLPLQHLITWAFVVMGPGAEAGTTANVLMQFKAAKSDLATPRARALQEILAPSKNRGRRECRMLDAPAASRAIKEKTHAHSQGPPKSHGIPCAMVLTAPPWSPWCTGLVSHHHLGELRPAS